MSWGEVGPIRPIIPTSHSLIEGEGFTAFPMRQHRREYLPFDISSNLYPGFNYFQLSTSTVTMYCRPKIETWGLKKIHFFQIKN